jgi:putative acetyltransferase
MPELEIRPIGPDDVEAVWRISLQPGVIETTMAMPSMRRAQRERRVEEMGDDEHTLVAERHGEVVGWGGLKVGAGRRRHAAELGMGIATAHQGKGIGTALLTALLDLADNWLGLRRVELHALARNDRARALYERHGFEVEGRLRGFVVSAGVLEDAWTMARLRPALERREEAEAPAVPAVPASPAPPAEDAAAEGGAAGEA